jgi:hypothetical protein
MTPSALAMHRAADRGTGIVTEPTAGSSPASLALSLPIMPHLDTTTLTIMYWILIAVAILLLILEVPTLIRKGLPLRASRAAATPEVIGRRALAPLLVAVFLLMETVPRVAGAPSIVVLALSILAFIPIVSLFVTSRSATRRGI